MSKTESEKLKLLSMEMTMAMTHLERVLEVILSLKKPELEPQCKRIIVLLSAAAFSVEKSRREQRMEDEDDE